MDDLNHEDLIVLTRVRYEWQSGLILASLEQQGVRATSSGGLTADFRTESPAWVKILVFEEDLPRAHEVLEEIRSGESEIDWSEVDVGEPVE